MNPILIYSPNSGPRLIYTLGFVFRDVLGVEFNLSLDVNEFNSYDGPKLSYSERALKDELFIFSSRLLFEEGIKDQEINLIDFEGSKAFYATHPRYALPFDIFSAVFFLISRYEEYLPHIKDQHNRFSPSESIAYQKGFLQKPIVDVWIYALKNKLIEKFPELKFPERRFKHLATLDIDSVYSFREKGLIRTSAGLLRDLFRLRFDLLMNRMKVLLRIVPDPYDTFSVQLELSKKYKTPLLYFFLLGDYDVFDKNIPWDNTHVQKLIRSVADYADVGIHPSYASNQDSNVLKMEVHRLSSILRRDVKKSRQHFLKLTFPETYRRLIDLDILHDYTMGYASEPGFRAGTCTPFYFYDLDTERETKLILHPFALMDGTLKDSQKMNPAQAIEKAKYLADQVKNVNGTFITLWHNHSFDETSEWKSWTNVFEELADYCYSLKK